jgi:hypothetical protein
MHASITLNARYYTKLHEWIAEGVILFSYAYKASRPTADITHTQAVSSHTYSGSLFTHILKPSL